MTPNIMRQLWSVVEATQANTLLQFDDANLVQWLVRQINSQETLDCYDTDTLDQYIKSRLSLIRDLAYERQ